MQQREGAHILLEVGAHCAVDRPVLQHHKLHEEGHASARCPGKRTSSASNAASRRKQRTMDIWPFHPAGTGYEVSLACTTQVVR